MKNILRFLLIGIVFIPGCASFPSVLHQEPRTIVLDGSPYSEETIGKFTSWECRDFVSGGKVLVEVGTFSGVHFAQDGFVIYDGGDSGNVTTYHRQGINHRWDWGPKGNDFSFVIKPDGAGLFYDFSNANSESIKANDVFKCEQR